MTICLRTGSPCKKASNPRNKRCNRHRDGHRIYCSQHRHTPCITKAFQKTIAAKKIPEAKNRGQSINVNKKLFLLAHFIFDLERLQILNLDIANITEITMQSLAIGVDEEKESTQTRDDNSYEGPIERLSICRKKLEATISLTTPAAVTGAPTKEAGAFEATAWSRHTMPLNALTVA